MTQGALARNREKDSKAKANGRDKRWGENGAKAMKWNEVFDLHGTGQVLLVRCLIWCRVYERVDTSSCTEHSLWPNIMEKQTLRSLFTCYTTIIWIFPWILCATHSQSTLFVQKFPREALPPGLCCIFKCLVVPLFLYSNRCTRRGGKVPACRRKIRASEMKTFPPLLDGNCMWLCLRLVYLWSFDHDSVRRCLIPAVLWQFAGWQKGLPVSEVRSEETGAWKAWRPAGRRSEETQTLARAIVRYTAAAGSHNFLPFVCFFFCRSLLPLLSPAQTVEWLS